MTKEEIEAVRNHISNIPAIGAMYAPVLLEWLEVALRQRDEARAEVDMLRGIECREQKLEEPESGSCGVCLRCAEERGAYWCLKAGARVIYSTAGNDAYRLLAREVCDRARDALRRGRTDDDHRKEDR
jgi:hypothetical protein